MIEMRKFGTLADGREVQAYTLTAPSGLRAVILNYGATLQALHLPNGTNVVLGHDIMAAYEAQDSYSGSIIGRNANRIVGASFEIEGKTFAVQDNNGTHNLHSGPDGFDRQIWEAEIEQDTLVLRHVSPEGQSGFPGEVSCMLRVSLHSKTLRLDMQATTSRPCPVNLTWHPYFNLGCARVDGHNLCVEAKYRTTLDKAIPIEIAATRFDFNRALPLGSVRLDDNYVGVRAATLAGPKATLQVTSSLPDMQFYTGDNLPVPRSGIAIEPQFRPDDINRDGRSLLRPGQTYQHWITYDVLPN